MIKLDLSRLSREDLEKAVTERCSAFGTVLEVIIVQDSTNYNFALAAVEMSNTTERLALLRQLGDSLSDEAVVIRIEQQ